FVYSCTTLPECRSDGLDEVTVGDEIALAVHRDGQLRQCASCGAEDRLAVLECIELRLVARAEETVSLLLVQRGRAADVGTDLRVGVVVAVVEVLLALTFDHPGGVRGGNRMSMTEL